MNFEYSPEWYAHKQARWLSTVSCAKDIVESEHLKIKDKKLGHFKLMYGDRKLTGHGLEVAFGCGNGMYWFSMLMPDTTYDMFDWNPAMKKIFPFLREIHGARLVDIWCGDHTSLQRKGNETYDWVNCADVFEHLSEDVYWIYLGEILRLMKPGALCGVYVGQPKLVQHIRVVPPSQTRKELESVGFRALSDYLYQKPVSQ